MVRGNPLALSRTSKQWVNSERRTEFLVATQRLLNVPKVIPLYFRTIAPSITQHPQLISEQLETPAPEKVIDAEHLTFINNLFPQEETMRRMTFVSCCLAVVAVLTFGQMAFAADVLSGTWKMNLAKSNYSPANLTPKSISITKIEAVQNGIKLVTDGVDSQGRKTHSEYTAKFDGKDVPVKSTIDGKPSPDQDAVAWKMIDDYTYENTAKLKGQTLTTTRVVLSRDGKTRTNTVSGKNAQGQTVNNTVVFDK
jgi:hypothetical protein